jgi:hypothetical protein
MLIIFLLLIGFGISVYGILAGVIGLYLGRMRWSRNKSLIGPAGHAAGLLCLGVSVALLKWLFYYGAMLGG